MHLIGTFRFRPSLENIFFPIDASTDPVHLYVTAGSHYLVKRVYTDHSIYLDRLFGDKRAHALPEIECQLFVTFLTSVVFVNGSSLDSENFTTCVQCVRNKTNGKAYIIYEIITNDYCRCISEAR